VWSKYPSLTANQVVARMLATLDRRTTAIDPAYGYGIVNAYRAVTANVPTSAPDPVAALARPFMNSHVARSRPIKAPAPIVHNATPPGSYTVGSSPRLYEPRVLVAAGVGLAGLVALIGLAIGGAVARRRRRLAAAFARPSPGSGQFGSEWTPTSDHSREN